MARWVSLLQLTRRSEAIPQLIPVLACARVPDWSIVRIYPRFQHLIGPPLGVQAGVPSGLRV
eukprot:6270528-Pyramimonas_sp.AAC.3